ncbi:uncharacterized protein Dwil_GK19998 [Drosophila willistoni]|uniref:Retinoblastoma family protein n=1 Tax=Drosophila willistoni TaxID=7260 RepID=B4MSL7_DROWI|nr:retinoblastoma family protein [Drosophila willistoni]EDW75106.1 uncharacterized protein Dwil_GK19998 [Drosophila willistoni]
MSNDVHKQELGAEVVAIGSVGGGGGESGVNSASASSPNSGAASTEDAQENTRAIYENLCRELNMDRQTEEDGYKTFQEVCQRCSLEGDVRHWLCCCLYMACRKFSMPTVNGEDAVVRGNGVSLNNLLRCCQISIYDFKTKIKQWCDMANLSPDCKNLIEIVDRKFSITFTLYKNYRVIFETIFLCPPNEKKHSKYSSLHANHTSHGRCSYIKLDDICWRLFLCAKNQKPATTVDLVTSYNLMICCIDLIYANVLAEKRSDLINPDFEGLPSNWNSPDFRARDNCILVYFCEMSVEAKAMKETLFPKIIASFFQAKTIYGNKDTMLGLLARENCERNLRSLNISYEQYVLSVGELDERILSAYDANEHTNLNEQALKPPVTPLTRKQDLPSHTTASDQKFEAVKNATKNVKQLLAFSGIKEPTDFVKQAGDDVVAKLVQSIKQMKQKFLAKYPEGIDRFELAECNFYYLLDHILRAETEQKINKPKIDLKRQLVQKVSLSIFNVTLMACCVELVLAAYETEWKFPWINDCFSISAFDFQKIIEIVVRHGSRVGFLNRSQIKHLNSIEETCLERLAWSRTSPVWEMIASAVKPLPTSLDVNRDQTAGALQIFLRKVYLLGWLRIQKLCSELNLSNPTPEKVWHIFEHSIAQETGLMQDRHLDQIIMCAIYIYIRVTKMAEPKFIDIMRAYRNQPQAVNNVYREVLILEGGETKYKDIIYFYNKHYVDRMKQFSISYLDRTVDPADLLLSPHPTERPALPKKLTQNHVYITQMQKNETLVSDNNMIYEFYRSPGKDLERMNEKVRGASGKRMLCFGDEAGLGPIDSKRLVRNLQSD